MRRAPRPIFAAIANLLLIHAMWIGSGPACVMKDLLELGGGMQNMPGMQMAASGSEASAMDAPHGPVGAPQDEQGACRFPWAPDGCHSMTPCAPLAIAADQQAIDAIANAPTGAEARTVVMPPTRVRTPEPPPPRA